MSKTDISKNIHSNPETKNKMVASRQQKQLWMLQQLHPDDSVYNIWATFRITGSLNVDKLNECFLRMLESNESLRSYFCVSQEELYQLVLPMSEVYGLHQKKLEVSEKEGIDETVTNFIIDQINRDFDPGLAPPFEGHLLKIAKDDHVILIIGHQILIDHESMHLILKDLSAHYESNSEKVTSCEFVNYSEFTEYQELKINENKYQQKLDFWKSTISVIDGFLDIPVSNTRPSVQSFKGAIFEFELAEDILNVILSMGKELEVPPSIVFLNAYFILLYRYTKNESITIGYPFSNRLDHRFSKVIGPTENILPFSVKFDGAMTFKDALKRVEESFQNTLGKQDVTFDALVEYIDPIRDPSYNPLFQVGFRYAKDFDLDLGNLTVKPIDSHKNVSIVDLFLNIREDKSKIRIQFVYNPQLFSSEVIQSLSNQFLTILSTRTEKSLKPISLIEILPESEKRKQIVEWNQTEYQHPISRKIHEFFEHQVERHPDNIAVEFEDISLTYKELNKRANQVAHYLQRFNLAPDDLVGVCLERSCEMMVALLGVLKAGAGYIPMDPAYPKERIAYIAENSSAPVLIIQESLLTFIPETNAKILCIDRDWDDIAVCSDDKFPDKADYNNIAYVIYTSGSTGKPKGVQVPHGAVANLMQSMARHQGLTESDILVSVTTYSFDLSVPDLYLPLYVGARTVYVRTEIAANGPQLAKIIQEKGVTFMDATPSTWMLLLDSGWQGSDKLTALCGGEAWPKKLAQELVPKVKKLWNMYGPTETTVWSTSFLISEQDLRVLVGKPIDNTSTYVLDENMQPLPIGVPGELYIGGHGVSLGYLGRPELNEKSFIENPFKKEGHPRIYKTGDSVRFTSDGNIEYINRLDNQVKVRGLRIELGEIESLLAKYIDIKQVVVVVREEDPNDKRLAAYFVGEAGKLIKEKELRNYLKGLLPAYMVPQHLVQLDELPKTPNGKIDRKALPKPQSLEKEKIIFQEPTGLTKNSIDKWFYKPVWSKNLLNTKAELPQAATCLVFLDDLGIGQALADLSRAKNYDIITIRSSDTYHKFNDHEYCINPEQGIAGYLSLVQDLAEQGRYPNRIAHLWMISQGERFRPGSSFFHRNLEHGFYCLTYLFQALAKVGIANNVQLLTVLNGSQKVFDDEEIRYPEKTCAIGPCKAITREFSQTRSSIVDIDIAIDKPEASAFITSLLKKRNKNQIAKTLERELLTPSENEVIAYRKGVRFTQKYKQIKLSAINDTPFRNEGVYFIAGGIGTSGLRIASHLRQKYNARLIIVDLLDLPEQKNWKNYVLGMDRDRETINGIEKLLSLDPNLENILYYCVDIADAEKMRKVIDEAANIFPSIHGVINASSSEDIQPIFSQHQNDIERGLSAKVRGSLVLWNLFKHANIDWLVFLSTCDTSIPDIGKSIRIAANAFLNAFVESSNSEKEPKMFCLEFGYRSGESIEMIDKVKNYTIDDHLNQYLLKHGIEADESSIAIENALKEKPGVISISSIDLPALINERDKRIIQFDEEEYIEPRDEIEKKLAEFWKEIIGIQNLSVTQNFFDIGGHSITAVRLFSKIKQEFDIQWPLSVLFSAPTIEKCAKMIREEALSRTDIDQGNSGFDYHFLVKMHDGPEKELSPVYIVAGGFGNVLNLRHLALQIGEERPVYGIQAKGLLGDETPHETFEEAASDYLVEIKRIQPRGPYFLAGFCSGGTIAFEMAQQLLKQGEKVSHVVMLDSIATDWGEVLTKKDKLAYHRKHFELHGMRYFLIWMMRRIDWERKKIQGRLGINSEKTGPAVFRGRLIFDATLRAENAYQPKLYSGKVTLFRPKLDKFVKLGIGRAINKQRDFVRYDNGWEPHIKLLDIQEIAAEPGDHDGFVLEPAVRDLARRFKQLL